MRTLRIPAAVAHAAGVITPARAKSRTTQACCEVRSARDERQNDPVTAAVAKTGGASR